MGHYYADLMCDRCGKLNCTCPLPTDQERANRYSGQWIIDDYKIVPADKFYLDNCKKQFFIMKFFEKTFFDSKNEAITARDALIDNTIRECLAKIDELVKIKGTYR